MSLTTFLYNDIVDSVTLTDRLESRATGTSKGGDYYWAAKQAANKMFHEDMSYDQAISEVMANMTKSKQRTDNQNVLKTLHEFRLANPGEAQAPPSGEITGPLKILTITLKPAFAIKKAGKVTAYIPWMFKEERLTAKIASVGIHMLKTELAHGEFANWRFSMIDTINGETFSRTHKNTAEAAETMLRSQEALLAMQFKKAG
ncbi:hypothetical protein [uncultured Brevundimonas sp.]|uniref:hypothetical protein n=1 Tax=uncultured Brevundimonas sp. TaxID=213418 RepID=UPI0025EE849B|nr:hypothetical protein [uncultured Brevundimonas sp.]